MKTNSRKSRPTILDVATKAGVSPTLVSQVLNNRPIRVAPATRERVLEAVHRLDYVPNAGARAIGSRRFRCVGLVLSAGPRGRYLPEELLHGVAEALNADGYRLTIMYLSEEALVQPSFVPSLHREWQVDGLLGCLATHLLPKGWADLVQHHNVPAVFINTKAFDYVVRPDDYASGREAVRYLVERGHRRIIHITSDRTEHYSREDRYAGWADACRKEGLPIPEAWYEDGRRLSPETWARKMAEFGPGERPTAATIYDIRTYWRFVAALNNCGLSVPDDISVFCQMVHSKDFGNLTGLTGCYFNWEDIGRRAAKLIVEIMAMSEDAEQVEPEPRELIEPPHIIAGRTVLPCSD